MFEQYEDIMTIQELQDALQISKNPTYELLGTNQIKAFRIGRIWKIPKASIIEYVSQQAGLSQYFHQARP